MFKLLLEKPDQLIYQIFGYLQETNPYSLTTLAFHVNKKPETIRRALQEWQQDAYNRSTGIGFYIKKDEIHGIYAKEHAQLFFSTLLHRSESFQLLLKVLRHPYRSATQLQQEMHLSAATFQRRVHQLQPILQNYHLELSFMHHPVLKGDEMQIRWLTFFVSLLADPPFHFSPIDWWHRYEEICTIRPLWLETWQPPKTAYYQPTFQLNERGSMFLWRQLIGLEPLWMKKEMAETLSFALSAHTNLNPINFSEVLQELHRIHCCCSLFSGTLFFPPIAVSKEAHSLTQSFRLLLPQYNDLLTEHPELPILYQGVLEKYYFLERGLMISEE